MTEISAIFSENVEFWLKSGSNAQMMNVTNMRNLISDILVQKFLRYDAKMNVGGKTSKKLKKKLC